MTNIPYTYLIGWSKLNVWYYGVRYAKNCNPSELWKTYFTSSKHVQTFRKLNGEPDIIIPRKIFNNKYKARKWETKVLQRMKVLENKNKWLNRNDILAPPIQFGPCTEKRRSSIQNSRLKTPKLICPVCSGSYDPGNFKQFHGEMCGKRKHLSIRNKKSYQKQLQNGNYHKPKPLYGVFVCPHCNKQGSNYGAMHRQHFDKCPKAFALLPRT